MAQASVYDQILDYTQRLGMHPEVGGDVRDRTAALKRQPHATRHELIGVLLRTGHNECFLSREPKSSFGSLRQTVKISSGASLGSDLPSN
jgi:hypothetical protein